MVSSHPALMIERLPIERAYTQTVVQGSQDGFVAAAQRFDSNYLIQLANFL
jgi:hypothetical protein